MHSQPLTPAHRQTLCQQDMLQHIPTFPTGKTSFVKSIEKTMDCSNLLRLREKCYSKQQGLRGEQENKVSTSVSLVDELVSKGDSRTTTPGSLRCLPQTLAAKRCLAFHHCELEALHYYGTPSDSHGPKALCACYDEGYCFGNPGIMKVDSDVVQEKERIFNHHQKAKRRVVNSRDKFKACQNISDRFHHCMKKAMSNPNPS